ncbi:MAG: SCP2 sterol-binding domain-containing protein [Actinobacteria bacterium]|nr:SCP2 sterol-binding domain-containing protein [Actinomycetota bacterium]MBU1943748.1 SCP2 sterol-binding domain-containing protein [Actinomycetota bacterium]MBU2688772.1 SCP2 sterol-binding domain-containing protein [Actinomycetota bacterium]
MAVFRDAAQAQQVLGEFWTEMLEDPEVGTKLKDTGMSALFKISDPNLLLYIDEGGILWNEDTSNKQPVVTFAMSGDVIHLFWLKKLNVAKALATRQVRTKGPIPKVMKLMPLLGPASQIYVKYCDKYDLPME